MEPIEEFTHHGKVIHIYPDTYPISPNDWEDDSLFLITTNNRYFSNQRKGFTLDKARDGDYKRDYHCLPLYAYIHSGIALSLGNGSYPFTCPWDSGQIGFVLVKKRYGFRNIRKAAESLVQEWNQYLNGDVWGFRIFEEGENGDLEELDSCWRLYGLDYCREEAKRSAEGG